MTTVGSVKELLEKISPALEISGGDVALKDKAKLKANIIDLLVWNAVFAENTDVKASSRWLIRRAAAKTGAFSASIQGYYDARAQGKFPGTTVPAINIRGMTYDVSRMIFRSAKGMEGGAVVFEIARSEIGYTFQRPDEYACVVLAAAVKEGWEGPVFIQGDHFQINAKKFQDNPKSETQAVKDLIREGVAAGFYNIDIDTSTLVDLSFDNVKDQQRLNYEVGAELTKVVREAEPKGLTVSVGGEIGEVGKKNSTVEEARAYLDGLKEKLGSLKSVSKLSIQTGTEHGGTPNADGSIADVNIDFASIKAISELCQRDYGLGGAVQHGASTCPRDAFNRFVSFGAVEVHLATGFQNIMFASQGLPADLRKRIDAWLVENCKDERKPNWTEDQFLYKTRKKGYGPFKKEWWSLAPENKDRICAELKEEFDFLFGQLGVKGTAKAVKETVKTVDVPFAMPEALKSAAQK